MEVSLPPSAPEISAWEKPKPGAGRNARSRTPTTRGHPLLHLRSPYADSTHDAHQPFGRCCISNPWGSTVDGAWVLHPVYT